MLFLLRSGHLPDHIGVHDYIVLFSTEEFKRVPNVRIGENGSDTDMNRITQCMHGKGTVSGVMQHRHTSPDRYAQQVPGILRICAGPWCSGISRIAATSAVPTATTRSGPECQTEGELSTTEALGLIDDLAEMGIPLILFTGGEPLMREDIWELAHHARKKGIKMALSTNGTLITAEVARRIRESGIEYAGISLDGARAVTHDRFRNSPGAFERTVAAFASLPGGRAPVRCPGNPDKGELRRARSTY